MRKAALAILATTLVSTGIFATRVEAMTVSRLGAAASSNLVEQAAVVCGPRGCVRRPAWRGGWNTWNGCRPGWTIQGGRCAPYRFGGGGYRWGW